MTAGARFQCSAAATERLEPLAITASQVRAWLLIEVDGAWGPNAIHESALGEFVPDHFKDELRARGVRAVCIRQVTRRHVDAVRLFFLVTRRPPDVGQLWTRTVSSLAEVAGVAAELSHTTVDLPGWTRHHNPVVMICTNGRHDQCCANLGRPVVRSLRGSAWAEHTWESSHIGGDRFAANVVVLPDSLYFGRCQPDAVVTLLDRVAAGSIDLAQFRGRSSYRLAEQAVEHFVRAEFGVVGINDVRVSPTSDPKHFDVTVVVGASSSADAGASADTGADGGAGTGEGVGAGAGADGAESSTLSLRAAVHRTMVKVPEPLTCSGSPGQLVPVFHLAALTPKPG